MERVFNIFLFCSVFCLSCFGQKDAVFPVTYFSISPKISIRALEARSDACAWFGANHGVWGFTENAGKTWHIDSIRVDSVYPEFRSIAVLNDSTVLLLSIASPAYLFKTTNKGKTWRLVYKNTHKDIFFDSMLFADAQNGVAVADPIGGNLQVIVTKNGGETWRDAAVHHASSFTLKEGESFFAASNTNIASHGMKIWYATGGQHARIITYKAEGEHGSFVAYDTPIVQGGKMTGIFSIDFFDDSLGIIAGGNYEQTDSAIVSLAITHDGGKTWKEIKSQKPFFGSCVQFRSADTFFVTGHDGTFMYHGAKISEVKSKEGAGLKYHTLRISPSGKTVWLAGDKGRIAFITLAP